jgi:hypothetical protein
MDKRQVKLATTPTICAHACALSHPRGFSGPAHGSFDNKQISGSVEIDHTVVKGNRNSKAFFVENIKSYFNGRLFF